MSDPSGDSSCILVKGARENNLRNLTARIPRGKLIGVTGVSGSGKSSFAFDVLYAEGHRKYVESLSAKARQALAQIRRPDVDYVQGLSPVIAIEQRTTAGASPRSTVATSTEIAESDMRMVKFAASPVQRLVTFVLFVKFSSAVQFHLDAQARREKRKQPTM